MRATLGAGRGGGQRGRTLPGDWWQQARVSEGGGARLKGWRCGKDYCFVFFFGTESTLVGGRREVNDEGVIKWGGRCRGSWRSGRGKCTC